MGSRVRAVSVEGLGTVNLPAARAAALEAVRGRPGATALELERATGSRRINSRLLELERQGLVRRGMPRPDTVTGRRAHVWHPASPMRLDDAVPVEVGLRRQRIERRARILRQATEEGMRVFREVAVNVLLSAGDQLGASLLAGMDIRVQEVGRG